MLLFLLTLATCRPRALLDDAFLCDSAQTGWTSHDWSSLDDTLRLPVVSSSPPPVYITPSSNTKQLDESTTQDPQLPSPTPARRRAFWSPPVLPLQTGSLQRSRCPLPTAHSLCRTSFQTYHEGEEAVSAGDFTSLRTAASRDVQPQKFICLLTSRLDIPNCFASAPPRWWKCLSLAVSPWCHLFSSSPATSPVNDESHPQLQGSSAGAHGHG